MSSSQVAGRLDREREATLTFRLHVYTPRNRHHPLSIAVVLIHLTDVNDNLPELVWPKKPLRVDPARSVGYVIDSVRATDRDLGDNRKLRYRLGMYIRHYRVSLYFQKLPASDRVLVDTNKKISDRV